jgi:hypothetical protein
MEARGPAGAVRRRVWAGLLGCALFATGCAQLPLKLATPDPGQKYEVVGEARGRADGVLLFGFIPIRYNSRFVRAQQAAIASKQGDLLINPVVTERWWWAFVLTGATTRVSGTVVKLKP